MIDVSQAQIIPPEQVKNFLLVMATLALANVGSLIGGAAQMYLAWRKMRLDINVAFDEIRKLKQTTKFLTKERDEK